ncbi:MAG: dynamin family protein [Anaerolineae bacterium]
MTEATATLEGALAAYREQELRLIGELLAELATIPEADPEDRRRLEEVARDLREMFYLIVIIGEFNAGKSSLVNSLLGESLLETGITPTTAMIDVVRYSETPRRVPVLQQGSVREWAHPNSLAPGVALVDTPGTGSVFKRHEDTAKAFLHRADLVLFVLSAKRALAETERVYIDLARSYGKKVILVINQVDLLSAQDRIEVKRFVEKQVDELLNFRPLIFLVSAKESLANGPDEGGIAALRAHLRDMLAESPPARQKLVAQLDFVESVVRSNAQKAQDRARLVDGDSLKVKDLDRELTEQTGHMDAPLLAARNEIDGALEAMRTRGHTFIQEHLSLRRIGRSLDRDKLKNEFETTVIGRAFDDVHAASLAYVNALVDGSRAYWRGVIDRLNDLHALLGQYADGADAAAFAEQREALQEAVRMAENQLRAYSPATMVAQLDETSSAQVNNFAISMITTVVSVIAALMALATPGALSAVPLATVAFVVAAPVAVIGGAASVMYWRRANSRVQMEFDAKVDTVKATYLDALETLTRKEKERLRQYGQQVLSPIFSQLEVLGARYSAQRTDLEHIGEQITELRRSMGE